MKSCTVKRQYFRLATALILAMALVPLVGAGRLDAQGQGEGLYQSFCSSCHGPEGTGGIVGRPNRGARPCSIRQAIHSFILGMEFLEVLTPQEIWQISQYLNSFEISGEDRYVVSCLGCHGKQGTGGRVAKDVQGESVGDIREAIRTEEAMGYLGCLPQGDLSQISTYLGQVDIGHPEYWSED